MQRQKHLAHVRKTLEPEEANWAIDIDDYALRSRVETFELVAYYLVGRREWQWLLVCCFPFDVGWRNRGLTWWRIRNHSRRR